MSVVLIKMLLKFQEMIISYAFQQSNLIKEKNVNISACVFCHFSNMQRSSPKEIKDFQRIFIIRKSVF